MCVSSRLLPVLLALASSGSLAAGQSIPSQTRHSMSELEPVARIHLAKTADWVAIADGAVWVGTTGPEGVAQIDPRTNTPTTIVALSGSPCAGLAVGFGDLYRFDVKALCCAAVPVPPRRELKPSGRFSRRETSS